MSLESTRSRRRSASLGLVLSHQLWSWWLHHSPTRLSISTGPRQPRKAAWEDRFEQTFGYRYEALGVSLHTQAPGGRHPSTVLSRLLEFCCPHRDSIGPHNPILVGKIRADRRRTRMNFPIFRSQATVSDNAPTGSGGCCLSRGTQ